MCKENKREKSIEAIKICYVVNGYETLPLYRSIFLGKGNSMKKYKLYLESHSVLGMKILFNAIIGIKFSPCYDITLSFEYWLL